MRSIFIAIALSALIVPVVSAQTSARIRNLDGKGSVYLTTNRYLGTELSPYDQRVSPYSTDGARNKYTIGGGQIFANDGTYLGRLNSNRYDPQSVANPFGVYGSRYSPSSINNPYGLYGSRYSTLSPNNPYSTTPPVVRYKR